MGCELYGHPYFHSCAGLWCVLCKDEHSQGNWSPRLWQAYAAPGQHGRLCSKTSCMISFERCRSESSSLHAISACQRQLKSQITLGQANGRQQADRPAVYDMHNHMIVANRHISCRLKLASVRQHTDAGLSAADMSGYHACYACENREKMMYAELRSAAHTWPDMTLSMLSCFSIEKG